VNYGIDAPGTVLLFLLIGIAGISAGLILILIYRGSRVPGWYGAVVGPCLTIGVTLFLQSLVMVWGSKVGKLRLRDRVIGAMAWRGDEAVLDVGCGHALMLIAAAKRLRTGRAVNIDLWIRADQAGNSREATWSNVVLEKMTDRVELKDGDARKLPFPDGAFDVVLSSWGCTIFMNVRDARRRFGRSSAY
jgi:SAM-dependent methyltransferase